MCFTAILAGTAIGGQLLQGYTQGRLAEAEGQARAAQANYQADQEDANARLADLRAKEATGIALTDSLVPEIAATRHISSMRARAGSSGLSLGKGYITLERDVDRYRHKAQDRILRAGDKASYEERLNAYSHRTSAANLRQGAEWETKLGKQRKRVSILGGIVGAAGTAYSVGTA